MLGGSAQLQQKAPLSGAQGLRGTVICERSSDFVIAPDLGKIKCKAFYGANAVLECVEVIRPWGRLDFVAAPDLLKIKHKALDRAAAVDAGFSDARGWETRSVDVDLLNIWIDEPA
jgi:hypothetical protein